LPDSEATQENLANALFLENDYWAKQTTAVNNGIAKAFSE